MMSTPLSSEVLLVGELHERLATAEQMSKRR